MNLSKEQFIEIWQSSKNIDEVIVRTGSTRSPERAWRLRKQGINLKRFPSRSKTGIVQGYGLMTWLKDHYPKVYSEWKEFEKNS